MFALVSAVAVQSRTAEIPIRLEPDLPLLFVDDSGVASRESAVRTYHVARTHLIPVLQPDRPWEGERVYIYGSVYRDDEGGGLRMWYMGRPGLESAGRSGASASRAPGMRNQGFDTTLYATSPDGVTWQKPDVGRFEFDGSRANNIVFDLHSPAVLLDRFDKDPARRYKMLGYLVQPTHAYQAAFSADGVNWQAYPKSSVLEYGDTITLAQHPATGEYLAYHKRPATVRGLGRRVVWLARSTDFQDWSVPELVLVPDEIDDSWVTRSHERTEIYNMSVYPHAAGFIGLPAIFRVMKVRERSELTPGQSPVDGPLDIQFATSRDGRSWHRTTPRLSVIPRGSPGTFDGGTILGVSSTPVHTDDQTWVYYTAINTGHGGPMPPKRIAIGRAEWRRHGFASLDAGPEGGRVQTVLLDFSNRNLVVNADASRGELRVGLVDAAGNPIEGHTSADCVPLRGDLTQWTVTWRNSITRTPAQPARVAIEMKNTRLFSLSASR